MLCQKCNQPMKEYVGFTNTGWDCVNEQCTQTLGEDPFALAGQDVQTLEEWMDGLRDAMKSLLGMPFTDDALDAFGEAHGIERLPNESNEDFRFRFQQLLKNR